MDSPRGSAGRIKPPPPPKPSAQVINSRLSRPPPPVLGPKPKLQRPPPPGATSPGPPLPKRPPPLVAKSGTKPVAEDGEKEDTQSSAVVRPSAPPQLPGKPPVSLPSYIKRAGVCVLPQPVLPSAGKTENQITETTQVSSTSSEDLESRIKAPPVDGNRNNLADDSSVDLPQESVLANDRNRDLHSRSNMLVDDNLNQNESEVESPEKATEENSPETEAKTVNEEMRPIRVMLPFNMQKPFSKIDEDDTQHGVSGDEQKGEQKGAPPIPAEQRGNVGKDSSKQVLPIPDVIPVNHPPAVTTKPRPRPTPRKRGSVMEKSENTPSKSSVKGHDDSSPQNSGMKDEQKPNMHQNAPISPSPAKAGSAPLPVQEGMSPRHVTQGSAAAQHGAPGSAPRPVPRKKPPRPNKPPPANRHSGSSDTDDSNIPKESHVKVADDDHKGGDSVAPDAQTHQGKDRGRARVRRNPFDDPKEKRHLDENPDLVERCPASEKSEMHEKSDSKEKYDEKENEGHKLTKTEKWLKRISFRKADTSPKASSPKAKVKSRSSFYVGCDVPAEDSPRVAVQDVKIEKIEAKSGRVESEDEAKVTEKPRPARKAPPVPKPPVIPQKTVESNMDAATGCPALPPRNTPAGSPAVPKRPTVTPSRKAPPRPSSSPARSSPVPPARPAPPTSPAPSNKTADTAASYPYAHPNKPTRPTRPATRTAPDMTAPSTTEKSESFSEKNMTEAEATSNVPTESGKERDTTESNQISDVPVAPPRAKRKKKKSQLLENDASLSESTKTGSVGGAVNTLIKGISQEACGSTDGSSAEDSPRVSSMETRDDSAAERGSKNEVEASKSVAKIPPLLENTLSVKTDSPRSSLALLDSVLQTYDSEEDDEGSRDLQSVKKRKPCSDSAVEGLGPAGRDLDQQEKQSLNAFIESVNDNSETMTMSHVAVLKEDHVNDGDDEDDDSKTKHVDINQVSREIHEDTLLKDESQIVSSKLADRNSSLNEVSEVGLNVHTSEHADQKLPMSKNGPSDTSQDSTSGSQTNKHGDDDFVKGTSSDLVDASPDSSVSVIRRERASGETVAMRRISADEETGVVTRAVITQPRNLSTTSCVLPSDFTVSPAPKKTRSHSESQVSVLVENSDEKEDDGALRKNYKKRSSFFKKRRSNPLTPPRTASSTFYVDLPEDFAPVALEEETTITEEDPQKSDANNQNLSPGRQREKSHSHENLAETIPADPTSLLDVPISPLRNRCSSVEVLLDEPVDDSSSATESHFGTSMSRSVSYDSKIIQRRGNRPIFVPPPPPPLSELDAEPIGAGRSKSMFVHKKVGSDQTELLRRSPGMEDITPGNKRSKVTGVSHFDVNMKCPEKYIAKKMDFSSFEKEGNQDDKDKNTPPPPLPPKVKGAKNSFDLLSAQKSHTTTDYDYADDHLDVDGAGNNKSSTSSTGSNIYEPVEAPSGGRETYYEDEDDVYWEIDEVPENGLRPVKHGRPPMPPPRRKNQMKQEPENVFTLPEDETDSVYHEPDELRGKNDSDETDGVYHEPDEIRGKNDSDDNEGKDDYLLPTMPTPSDKNRYTNSPIGGADKQFNESSPDGSTKPGRTEQTQSKAEADDVNSSVRIVVEKSEDLKDQSLIEQSYYENFESATEGSSNVSGYLDKGSDVNTYENFQSKDISVDDVDGSSAKSDNEYLLPDAWSGNNQSADVSLGGSTSSDAPQPADTSSNLEVTTPSSEPGYMSVWEMRSLKESSHPQEKVAPPIKSPSRPFSTVSADGHYIPMSCTSSSSSGSSSTGHGGELGTRDPRRLVELGSNLSIAEEDTDSSAPMERSSSEEEIAEGVMEHTYEAIENVLPPRKNSTKKRDKVFAVAEEIMTTERSFIYVLKLLNEDFRNAVNNASEKCQREVLPQNILNQILRHLPQLQNFNQELLHDLEDRIKNWDKCKKVADIFVKKGPFLKLYTPYFKDFESSRAVLEDACERFPDFANTLAEFEATPACKCLAVKHFMLKPIQRIPQYKLLLQSYLKHLPVDSPDYQDTQEALKIVSAVASHANEQMRQGDNFTQLFHIQTHLVGQFEVVKPGRVLIKQGEILKLSRKEMQTRMFFLMNDVLLYTTPSFPNYWLNNAIPLNGVKVRIPSREDVCNEFHIISTQRSLILSGRSGEERDEWIAALTSSIEEHKKRQHSFLPQAAQQVMGEPDKDFKLGSKAPLWIPDARVSMCMRCATEFTITWRRHHCRGCGKVVCGSCSMHKLPLSYLDNALGRVCDDCYNTLNKESAPAGRESISSQDLPDGSPLRSSIFKKFDSILKGEFIRTSKQIPSVLKEVSANQQDCDISGYLGVMRNRRWRRFWFVLKEKVLYTFKASEDLAASESTPVLGYHIQALTTWFEGANPALLFSIYHDNSLSAQGGNGRTVFRAESTESRDRWLAAMREATTP